MSKDVTVKIEAMLSEIKDRMVDKQGIGLGFLESTSIRALIAWKAHESGQAVYTVAEMLRSHFCEDTIDGIADFDGAVRFLVDLDLKQSIN